MSPEDIFVAVQTCPQRREARVPTLDSIERSDIGSRYELLEQLVPPPPENETPRQRRRRLRTLARRVPPPATLVMEHLRRVLQTMYDSGAEYCLRLEDDILVNRHVLHNLSTWPALEDRDFGAGWLFCTKPLLDDRLRVRRSRGSGTPYRACKEMFAALGVLFRRNMIPEVLRRLKGPAQDIGLSTAVWKSGKRCFFHVPALVENRVELPSVRGNGVSLRYHVAGELFDPEWKR